jgi:Tol biopolymer transport system component
MKHHQVFITNAVVPAIRLVSLAVVLSVAACGGGSSGSSTDATTQPQLLAGKIYGPTGAQVTLQNNAADDLALTIQPSAATTLPYDVNDFSFATKLSPGSHYAASVKSFGGNLLCQTFAGASGTIPLASGTLRVGCEYAFDRISRSADNSVLGTFFDSTSPVLGGASVTVGGSSPQGEGRFVAFVSSAAMAGASGAHRQVFVRDRAKGEVFLVSASSTGVEGNADSGNPVLSADGLTVAFDSTASNLVSADSNSSLDVFVRKFNDPTTMRRASVGAGGGEFHSPSGKPSLSGDGRYLAFETIRSNLTNNVAGSDNTTVVVRGDLTTGINVVVSRSVTGATVGGLSPMLSEDGSRVVFWSFDSDLVASDTNGLWDIFVLDFGTDTMQRVSVTATGGERNQGVESASRVVVPAISGNGRYVAYATTASNLVAGDTNGLQDVFVVDTQAGTVTRASVSGAGAQADGDAPIGQGERLGLSYDGTWVTFTSTASNLGAATTTTGIGNVFLHNTQTGQTLVVSNNTSSGSVGGPALLSRNAAYTAFGSGGGLDPRYPGSGLFVGFTGKATAFSWLTN